MTRKILITGAGSGLGEGTAVGCVPTGVDDPLTSAIGTLAGLVEFASGVPA